MKPKTLAEIFKDDVNSPMIKPIQLDQEQETQTMTAKKTTDRIEAHGVKGMKSTPWEKDIQERERTDDMGRQARRRDLRHQRRRLVTHSQPRRTRP